MVATIAVKLNYYRIDTSTADGTAAYTALQGSLLARGLAPWNVDMRYSKIFAENQNAYKFVEMIRALAKHKNGRVAIETAHLFDNQWNTAPVAGITDSGLRVFAWSRFEYPNRHIQEGYYLDLPAEFVTLLDNTYVCGYCGKQEPAAKGYVFCPHCIDSEYLKQSDLYLTRMRPVSDGRQARAPLTDAESAHLLPLYKDAQVNGSTERGRKRIAAARKAIAAERESSIAQANEKAGAATWVLDHVPGMHGNWLFYTHNNVHSFGWRKPLEACEVSALLDCISEFPYTYEIKCADGRTLNGNVG